MNRSNRPFPAGRFSLITIALVLGVAPAAAADGHTVALVVSSSHYCRHAPCTPVLDAGYLRLPSGPVVGSDNPRATIEVEPGDTVVWTYRDKEYCDPVTQPSTNDVYDCKGHEVRFENGTPQGTAPIGFLPARSGPVAITWTVPADAQPGTRIRYFCSLSDAQYPADLVTTHYPYGMTGIFQVV
jgi:hypothetical protein